ncbi:YmfQ family protein [Acetobacter sp.]|uniref:YmfQ family protein n=1 Tax=Acetobacter sp. TaxID=440 RepID=UPI0039EC526E
MTYSADDFLAAFQRHLPTGPIWPRDPGSNQAAALRCLMPTLERLAQRDANLLIDAFPATTVELLPEWQASLGLPDACAGTDPTIEQQRAQVVARLTDSGGASVDYFVGFAANLGYDISITEFAPARADFLCADDPVYDPFWAYMWRVNAPAVTVEYFSADVSFADEPLAEWGNAVLECEIQARKPARTTVFFAYG